MSSNQSASDTRRDSAAQGPHFKPPPVVEGDVPEGVCAPTDRSLECLTQGRIEVLKLVALGFTSGEIAGQLCISVKAVDGRRYSLMKKLGIHDRVHLCRYAIRQGLIQP